MELLIKELPIVYNIEKYYNGKDLIEAIEKKVGIV